MEWQRFFDIYPFSEDRADIRAAQIAAAITNDGIATRAQAAGKKSYTPIPTARFLPDYLGTREPVSANKSIEQQKDEFSAFVRKFKDVTGQK